MLLTKQKYRLSGEDPDQKVAVGVQLENPAVAVVDQVIALDRQVERAIAEAEAVHVARVALRNPMVINDQARGRQDRVTKVGKERKTSENNHLIQRESAGVGRIVVKANDLVLRSFGRVVSQRLIYCPIVNMSALVDLSYFW